MDLLKIACRVAGQARAGEEVEAYAVLSRDTEVRAFEGEVENFSQAETRGIGVRVIADHREGYAYSGSLDDEGVAFALTEARDNSAFAQADETLGLATPVDCSDAGRADLDLWREEMVSVGPEEKIRLALELESLTRSLDERVRSIRLADYGDSLTESAVANSLGVSATSRRTSCSASTYAIAGEGDDTQTGFGFSTGRSVGEIDIEGSAREAVERSVRMLGARQIASTRLPVVLDPLVARSFISLLGVPLSGESLSKGRSFFAGRLGEEVAAPVVTLAEDPLDTRAYGAANVDGEGVPTRRVELVGDGRLQGFVHNVLTARRVGDGARTTGSAMRGYTSSPGVGFRNLHASPGDLSLERLLASAGTALYVQSVQGLHSGANPISGDFSTGAEGLMVRNGAFAEPVREVTVASTLQRMLLDIVAVGGDVRWLPGGLGSSILVSEMTIGGR